MRNLKFMELAWKIKELQSWARIYHEIFFAINLNTFKKCQPNGGK